MIDWGDGVVTTASGDPASQTHPYGNGTQSYTITAVGSSSAGNFKGTLPVSITDVGPSGLVLTASAANYGGNDSMILSGTFTNNSPQESLGVSINWGDGSPQTTFGLDPGATSFQYPAQQYLRSGSYPIVVTVTDADNLSTSNSASPLTVNYSNPAPTELALSLDQSTINLGGQVNLSGSFTDLQSQASHTVTIDWGDGVGSPDVTTLALDAGETTFQADPHTYTTASTTPYTITVVVSGADGSTTKPRAPWRSAAPLPEVMIGAEVPVVSDGGGQGRFLVTRTDTSDTPLTVNYQITGSAPAGDYTVKDSADTTLTGSVTIPANEASAMIDITPTNGALTSSETVIVNLTSGSGYNVAGVFSAAQVTIADDGGTFGSGKGTVNASLTLYNPDGTVQATGGLAILGDFVPMVLNVSGDPTGQTFYFQCSGGGIIATDVAGQDPVGNPLTLTGPDMTLFLGDTSENAGTVSADLWESVSGGYSSGTTFCACHQEREPAAIDV